MAYPFCVVVPRELVLLRESFCEDELRVEEKVEGGGAAIRDVPVGVVLRPADDGLKTPFSFERKELVRILRCLELLKDLDRC